MTFFCLRYGRCIPSSSWLLHWRCPILFVVPPFLGRVRLEARTESTGWLTPRSRTWEGAGRAIDLSLESELRPIGLLHAAVLEHVRVRIEDGHAIRLVPREDLADARADRIVVATARPEQREAREAVTAVEVDDLEVL